MEILIATDFSDLADAAVRVGREYAERFTARVHLFHTLWSSEYDVTRLLARSRELLGIGVPVVIASATGDPADEIVRYARAHDIELIVLGTHGRTGLTRALLGSVAERVIRTAPCPVLVVPAGREANEVTSALAPGEAASRCLSCGQPSRELICEPCRARIRGEALERRRREYHGGLV